MGTALAFVAGSGSWLRIASALSRELPMEEHLPSMELQSVEGGRHCECVRMCQCRVILEVCEELQR
jgi:hypothetical protein